MNRSGAPGRAVGTGTGSSTRLSPGPNGPTRPASSTTAGLPVGYQYSVTGQATLVAAAPTLRTSISTDTLPRSSRQVTLRTTRSGLRPGRGVGAPVPVPPARRGAGLYVCVCSLFVSFSSPTTPRPEPGSWSATARNRTAEARVDTGTHTGPSFSLAPWARGPVCHVLTGFPRFFPCSTNRATGKRPLVADVPTLATTTHALTPPDPSSSVICRTVRSGPVRIRRRSTPRTGLRLGPAPNWPVVSSSSALASVAPAYARAPRYRPVSAPGDSPYFAPGDSPGVNAPVPGRGRRPCFRLG